MHATVEAAKKLRKAAGISQRDIAAAIHKSSRDVSHIESHSQLLTFETGCRLLAYLRSCPGVQTDRWVELMLNFLSELVEYFAWTLDPQMHVDKITGRNECNLFMDLEKGSCLAADFRMISGENTASALMNLFAKVKAMADEHTDEFIECRLSKGYLTKLTTFFEELKGQK